MSKPADSTGVKRSRANVAILHCRENDDGDVRHRCLQLATGINSTATGQHDIENNDFGTTDPCLFQQFGDCRGAPDDLAVTPQKPFQRGQQRHAIVGQKNTRLRLPGVSAHGAKGPRCNGIVTATRVPCAVGREWISKLPPSIRARSFML